MTTHRSLTKLERRAHQSLHTLVEIPDQDNTEFVSGGATRDRFGKRHSIPKKDNAS